MNKQIYITAICSKYHEDSLKFGLKLEPTDHTYKFFHGKICWFKTEDVEVTEHMIDDDRASAEKGSLQQMKIYHVKMKLDLFLEKKVKLENLSIIKIENLK